MTATQTTTPTTATKRVPMHSLRKTALIGGALYVLTFASSIPAAVLLLGSVLNDPDYIVGPGPDTAVLLACFLDVINALAAIGTAVVLFPVVKRQNESVALGFIGSRVLEAAVIMTGVVTLLAVVTLRRNWPEPPEWTRPRSAPSGSRWSRSAIGRSCSGPSSCQA